MALTKIQSGSFEAGAIETADLSSNTTAAFAVSLTPKVTTVNVANSSFVELDDTAVSTNGGYVIITGSDFQSGAVVLVDTTQATSTTYVNSTTLRVQIPAKSAATYNIYVVNPDGGVGIKLNGVNYSATPTWVTSSPLANVLTDVAFTGTFEATGATSYSVDSGSSLPDGMTLVGANGYYYGTITVANDTTYSFTINATDAENQDSPATFNLTALAVILDNYFNSTVLLLKGDGTNAAQNQTFVDSSNNNFTITRNGNTTQGSFSPFSPTGWSNYFDGTGDYLTVASNTAIDVSTGDFTIEAWVYPIKRTNTVDSVFGYGTYSMMLYQNGSNWALEVGNGSSNYFILSSNSINFNSWTHLAVTRNGNNFNLWVNGNSVDTNSTASSIATSSKTLYVGLNYSASTQAFTGNISNFRIVKGTAVYTSNFTPSTTPLTAVSGTSLLTCQSNRFIDNSTNNFAITRVGDAKVVAFSPFAPTTSYSTTTHGGSAYFDGTDDALTLPSNSALALGDGDFTVEAWVYNQNGANLYPDIYSNSGSIISFLLNDRSSVYGSILADDNYPGSGNATLLTATAAIYQNTWTHVAWVRYGSTITVYINGIVSGTATSSTNHTREMQVVGAIAQGGAPNIYFWNGYISNLRVVKGSAVYTSAFTPPTTPPTVVSGTSLLLNFTNAGIYDSTAKNVLETVGNAQVSTSVKKYGTGSMYFDGSGDYLSSRYDPWMRLANYDFTIECWIRLAATQADMGIVSSYENSNGWLLRLGSTFIRFFAGSSQISVDANYSFSTDTWYHLAVTRSGTSLRFFVDGSQVGSTATVGSATDTTTQGMFIGRTQTITNDYNGYIDDLRITKGIARYTSNFTPPTAALPVQ